MNVLQRRIFIDHESHIETQRDKKIKERILSEENSHDSIFHGKQTKLRPRGFRIFKNKEGLTKNQDDEN